MRQPRLYVDIPLAVGTSATLDPGASHYLAQVLRLKAGDKLRPFNGSDGEFVASIETADRKKTTIAITDLSRQCEEPTLCVNLGLGLSRGDRMDFAIQKSTELGVTSLTPLYTQFSEVKFKQTERMEKKMNHWQKIAISASEQSGRLTVPKINSPCSIEQWLENAQSSLKLILSPRGDKSFSDLSASKHCDLLIGPEGGFSDQEIAAARKTAFAEISLGDRIMRTETAPIAALAILQFRFGDLS
ncbi:MAG: 16S rRNA (uracil(1498)-N(3))-methyltransferase [Pseudohongiellaceae bacterium]